MTKRILVSLAIVASVIVAARLAMHNVPTADAHGPGVTGNWEYCNSVCNRMPNDASRHWYNPNGGLVCSYNITNGCNSGNDKMAGMCPTGFASCFQECTGSSQTGSTTMGCHGYFCASGAAGQEGTCGGPSGSGDRTRCGGQGTKTYQAWGTTSDCAGASCWCDASCVQYGDCCPDAGHCGEVATTCEATNSCGGHNAANNCYCDQSCLKYGDCCEGGPCGN